MTIFLILAPYAVFSLLMLMTSAAPSLFVAAAVGLAVVASDLIRGRLIKMFGAGSAVLFAATGLYLALIDPGMSSWAIRLTVDAGPFAIALMSLVIRRPFTLQYAREMVDAETARLPGFIRANYIITAAWAGASMLMMFANVALIYVPGMPLWTGLVIAFAARNSAVYFTRWYPAYRMAKYAASPAAALPVS